MAKVTLMPSGQVVEVDEKTSLLRSLTAQGIYIKSSCGGIASCSDCLVKVKAGVENINKPTFDETRFIGNVFHITKERLSCQTYCIGDVTIDISAHDKGKDEEKRLNKSVEFSKKRRR